MPSRQEQLTSQAYVLYSKPYQENSLILDVLSRENGRIQLLAKGVKKSKKGLSFALQPFRTLQIKYLLKSNLSILVDAEIIENNDKPFKDNKVLYSAYYLNELLIRLLPSHEEVASIFSLYQQTIQSLKEFSLYEHAIVKSELCLRLFELKLLNQIGYEVDLQTSALTAKQIESDLNYVYIENIGFVSTLELEHPSFNQQNTIVLSGKTRGECLIKLGQEEQDFFQDNLICRQQIKQLLRNILHLHLGEKPLKTRELYQQLFVKNKITIHKSN
ncbi:MAG: DNA repair protein RecO [Gammaproteobacteria bacterium]|nr:DNA repair protein RecO [Gammaproteobacteria bacterium]